MFSVSVHAQTATVTWDSLHQNIDGFGAEQFADLTAAQAQFLFSTTPGTGIGLSLMRTVIAPWDDTGNTGSGYCVTVNAKCANGWFAHNLTNYSLSQSFGSGVRYGAIFPIAPGVLDSLGTSAYCKNGGAQNTLPSGNYGATANYIVNYVNSLKTYAGVTPFVIELTTEPDNCPSTYGGLVWTGAQIDAFAKVVGPALNTAGLFPATKLMAASTLAWGNIPTYANATFSDSSAYQWMYGATGHDYDNFNCRANPATCPYPLAQNLGKALWETEHANYTSSCVNTMADALQWAQEIHDWMAIANANAWNYYLMVNENDGFDGLICLDGTTKRKMAYAMGNYSLFVRPGWYRIDATENPQAGVYVTAYKDSSSGNFAIVAINQNGSDTPQTFSLGGFSATTVTPWITSASLNLAQQSDVSVSSGAFAGTLPAQSVTTFVGASGNAGQGSGSTRPSPPRSLSAVVR